MERQTFPVGLAAAFYLVLAGVGWGVTQWFWDRDVFVWTDGWAQACWIDGLLGAGFGLVVVVLTGVLEEHTAWAARLSHQFKQILGPITVFDAFVLAVSSGLAEEIFFRGFLQQILTDVAFDGLPYAAVIGLVASSLIFGLVHKGPDASFRPWTIFALVVGTALGGLYWLTGNLLAPVIAHFTINFLNLSLIGAEDSE